MASLTVRGNPYIIGPPIRDPQRFFGRREKFDFIRSVLLSRTPVILLHGQRRIGKSSVLAQIPALDGLEDFVFVLLDLQYVSKEPLSGILFKLAQAIATAAAQRGTLVRLPARADLDQDPLIFRRAFVPEVLTRLASGELVLLLDEFDVVDDRSAPAVSAPFFDYLRASIYETKRLHLIAVTGRRADDLGEMLSLFKDAPTQEIGLLSRESATELIRKPAESTLEFDDSAVNAILELSSGHPYFTQLLSYAVFQRAEQRQRFQVDRADVEAVVDKAIESGFAGLAWFHGGLPIPERVVFAALAECQQDGGEPCDVVSVTAALENVGVVVTPDIAQAIDQLKDWGFVTQPALAGKPVFRVTVELVRRWMVRYHPLRNEIKALEKTVPKAERRYTDARKLGLDDETAYTLAREVLASNPNHFSALSDAAELAFKLERWGAAEAAAAYERLYKSDPTPRNAERLTTALVEAAKYDLDRGDLESAHRNATDATHVDPESSEAKTLLDAIAEQTLQDLAARNPFVVGPPVPPEAFTGRKSQIAAVMSAVAHRASVLLFGERRMGKSSLLRYLASPEPWRGDSFFSGRIVPVYIDCGTLAGPWQDTLWRAIAAELRAKFSQTADASQVFDRLDQILSHLPANLGTILELVANEGWTPVILLDEFDSVLDAADRIHAVTQIRFLAIRTRACFVLATRRQPSELSESSSTASPWYDWFSLVPVGRLEEDEVAELIKKMPFDLTFEEVSWLRTAAGRYPYLLSCGLSSLFEQHVAARKFDALGSTLALTNTAFDFFESLWSGASAIEKGVLAVCAILDCERRLEIRFAAPLASSRRIAPRAAVFASLQARGIIGDVRSRKPILESSLLEYWILQRLESISAAEEGEIAAAFRSPHDGESEGELPAAMNEIAERQLTEDIEPWTRPMKES